MGAYEEKWQLQYKCIRTAFNPKYIAPDLNIVHCSSRGEAKLPINTIAAHFLPFSPAAVQSWHYEINLKALEPEGEVLTDRSTNKQKSDRGQINPLRTKEPMKNIASFHTSSASPVLVGQKISKPREIGRAYYSRP